MGEDDAEEPSSLETEAPHDINVYHISDPEEGQSLLITWDGNGYDQRTHWVQADKEDGVVSLADWE